MPDLQPDRDRLASLPSLPRDEGGPVFAEPWQAQAFALAVRLSAQGYFTWKEWAAALADELKSAADRGEPGRRLPLLRALAGGARTSRDCERLSRIQTRCSPAKRPGPKPIDVRHTANPSIWRTDPASLTLLMDHAIFIGFRRGLCEHRRF